MSLNSPVLKYDSSTSDEDVPLSKNNSFNETNFQKTGSFTSFNFFKDKEIIIFNPGKTCNKGLLQGPRRVLRLCFCGLFLPVLLISIPLYVRLILYPPYQLTFAPTDQRLLNRRVSSIWCQSQSVHMNGSFNAYMLYEEPTLRPQYQTHYMLRHIILKDDFKEYWGFFLLKGSIVKVDLCNRYDGGSLMIMRGVDNLRECAWINQMDSAEDDEDHNEQSNESGDTEEVIQEAFAVDRMNFDPIGNFKGKKNKGRISKVITFKGSENTLKNNITSQERKNLLDLYVKRIIKLSKASQEIAELFGKQNFSLSQKIQSLTTDEKSLDEEVQNFKNLKRKSTKKKIKGKTKTKKDKAKSKEEKERIKRALNDFIPDEGKELDDEEVPIQKTKHEGMKFLNPGKLTVLSRYNKTDEELYKEIFKTPKGLNFERGFFNTSTDGDLSNEEQRSSFSSSEEALANCKGLLGAIPLYPNPYCVGFKSAPSNRITYKIPITGTYYFVFSSDNEIYDSNMFFNMTLQRVVYDTKDSKEACFNQSECSLAFSFWSHDQAVIEVPESDWNSTFILDTKCEPRVPVYLFFVMLVPIVFLFCAFQ